MTIQEVTTLAFTVSTYPLIFKFAISLVWVNRANVWGSRVLCWLYLDNVFIASQQIDRIASHIEVFEPLIDIECGSSP